jgi:hypothetical protein
MRAGWYWMRLSRFLMMTASWSTSRAARLPRPFFMADQAPDRVELGSVGGQPHLGQPAGAGADQGVHRGADVGVQVIPDQDDRGLQFLVRGGDQVSVVSFGHRAALALAPAVDADPVIQMAPRAGPQAHQARHRYPARALAGHADHRGQAAGRPGPGPGRAQVLPGLVLKAHIRPGRRR